MIKRLLTFALLIFFALPTWAAVTTVGTPASDQGNNATALTSITVPVGADVCYFALFRNGEDPVSSVENFGGVTPGLVGNYLDILYLYRVVSPSSGLTAAQANLSTGVLWSMHAICLDGVDTADPDDAPETNTEIETTSVSTPAMTSTVGDLVLAFGLMVFEDIDVFAGSTLSTEEQSIDGGQASTALVYEAGAASVTTGVSSSTISFGDNRILAVNVNAAGGGGGSTGIILKRRKH